MTTLAAEVRDAMKAAGMDPDTDPLAPLVKVLVKVGDRAERGVTAEAVIAELERLSPEIAKQLGQQGARAVDGALQTRSRAIAWRSAALVAASLLVAIGMGFWVGGMVERGGCTVVPQVDGSRACIIVAWRDTPGQHARR